MQSPNGYRIPRITCAKAFRAASEAIRKEPGRQGTESDFYIDWGYFHKDYKKCNMKRRMEYHLQVETPHANLVDGMRWLQGTYTKRFNIRHKLWGHLFQGRYKALVVDPGEDYFSRLRVISISIQLERSASIGKRAGCRIMRGAVILFI